MINPIMPHDSCDHCDPIMHHDESYHAIFAECSLVMVPVLHCILCLDDDDGDGDGGVNVASLLIILTILTITCKQTV